jgi:hypothetical protein
VSHFLIQELQQSFEQHGTSCALLTLPRQMKQLNISSID